MRLIDADYITEGRVSNDPVVIAAKCAPTIDAIPVEWLNEMKRWAAADGDNECVYVIAYLLDRWQKEQEAQDSGCKNNRS